MPPVSAPTESQILTSYLLNPSSLPTILAHDQFRLLFPAKLRKHPHLKPLYRDLQFLRSLDVDIVRENITQEVRKGDRMRVDMWRALREQNIRPYAGGDDGKVGNRIKGDQDAMEAEIDGVLFGLSGSTSMLSANSRVRTPDALSYHSLESLLEEMEKAARITESEANMMENEVKQLVAELSDTVGELSDLRYGNFAKGAGSRTDGGREVVEEVRRALARLDDAVNNHAVVAGNELRYTEL
ncbi:putative TPA: conserved hypothetical protein [Phaeomoniella chlamydospora]|uniref:Cnl2 nkp2 family protein n=1 Tax=Phaeomoniella chlamydospora TaxID=158046 RepID=A0A0G2EF27_PHACM|nr:putative TPA: conserved hypothetical protein [Phaeomoniella chlamydospora]